MESTHGQGSAIITTDYQWRVSIDPEGQDDGQIIFVASHPEFDGVLGTGETPEAALADLHAARR